MSKTTYAVPNEIANEDTSDATKVMGNFEYLENALNDFNGENVTTGTIPDTALTANPATIRDETLADHVVSGLTSADSGATLTGVVAAGVAYIEGIRVSVNSFSNAYTASKDCYVDLDKNGSFHVTEVANGAAIPAVYANSTRICKFVTNGTEITSYTDLRNLNPQRIAVNSQSTAGVNSNLQNQYFQRGEKSLAIAGAGQGKDVTVTLPVPYDDANYTVYITPSYSYGGMTMSDIVVKPSSRTTTQFVIEASCVVGSGTVTYHWITVGTKA